jgi:hypothetical protein
MLMADTASLPTPEPAFVAHLLEEAPKLAAAVEVAKRLALSLAAAVRKISTLC